MVYEFSNVPDPALNLESIPEIGVAPCFKPSTYPKSPRKARGRPKSKARDVPNRGLEDQHKTAR